MKRTETKPDLSLFPCELQKLFEGAKVFDSSSSPEARVYFIDKDGGYYLKTGAKRSLRGISTAKISRPRCLHISPASAILC